MMSVIKFYYQNVPKNNVADNPNGPTYRYENEDNIETYWQNKGYNEQGGQP